MSGLLGPVTMSVPDSPLAARLSAWSTNMYCPGTSSLRSTIAAPPGGIDREAAAKLGLKFVWARGLGSRAPVTVGRSQWSGIRRRIEDIVGRK